MQLPERAVAALPDVTVRPLVADLGSAAGLVEVRRRLRVGNPAAFQGASQEVLSDLGIGKTITLTSTYDHRVIQGAGSGEFLARAVVASEFPDCPVNSLADTYGQAVSQCAAAFAVAVLAKDAMN